MQYKIYKKVYEKIQTLQNRLLVLIYIFNPLSTVLNRRIPQYLSYAGFLVEEF